MPVDPRNELDRTGMARILNHLVEQLYGGTTVPPTEGGHLFRTICEERRQHGDLFWTERRIHELARELGFWPWSVSQINTAARAQSGAPDGIVLPDFEPGTALDSPDGAVPGHGVVSDAPQPA
jgi:hypothetical protein